MVIDYIVDTHLNNDKTTQNKTSDRKRKGSTQHSTGYFIIGRESSMNFLKVIYLLTLIYNEFIYLPLFDSVNELKYGIDL